MRGINKDVLVASVHHEDGAALTGMGAQERLPKNRQRQAMGSFQEGNCSRPPPACFLPQQTTASPAEACLASAVVTDVIEF